MKRILTALIAVSALTGTVAFADSGRHDSRQGQRDWQDRNRHNDRRDYGHRDYGHRDYGRRDFDRRDYRHRDFDRRDYGRPHRDYRHYDPRPRYYHSPYHRPRGYVYRSWRTGDRLPTAYYAPRYIVQDFHHYHLRQPPRGYHWVRVDNDVVLAAIAGGIVAHVVTGLFYQA